MMWILRRSSRCTLSGDGSIDLFGLKKNTGFYCRKNEQLCDSGLIDLYDGDESGFSLQPSVPDGWQFAGEEVSCPSENGGAINR